MTLNDNIRRLTETHVAEYHGKSGTVPALLRQLEDAVTDSLGAASGGGGDSLPFSEEASDLLGSITSEAREYCREHGIVPATAVDAVRAIAAMPDPDGYYEHATLDWCELIEALLAPVKPRRKLEGIPCPACTQHRTDERKAALTAGIWAPDEKFLPIGDWEVACGACGALWRGMEIGWLLVALRARSGGKVEG